MNLFMWSMWVSFLVSMIVIRLKYQSFGQFISWFQSFMYFFHQNKDWKHKLMDLITDISAFEDPHWDSHHIETQIDHIKTLYTCDQRGMSNIVFFRFWFVHWYFQQKQRKLYSNFQARWKVSKNCGDSGQSWSPFTIVTRR